MFAKRFLIAPVAFFTVTFLVGHGRGDDKKADDKPSRIAYKFGPEGQVGLAVLDKDNRIPLTFADDGDTNSTLVRIDGAGVEFGSEDGKWEAKNVPLEKGKRGHKSTWVCKKISITQIVQIVPSKTGNFDACLISYAIENQDKQKHDVGLRTMIDTQINQNDGNAFGVNKELITKSADYKTAKDVPALVRVLEKADLKNPGFTAHFSLKVGGGREAPDRFSITTLPADFEAWEVPVKDIGEDAAVALYWNPRELGTGNRRVLGYGYGQGVVSLGEGKIQK